MQFGIYRGVNVLQDTNSDGKPDTGPLAPGASYKVVLKATLPANATGSNFNVVKTATSVVDPAQNDSVTDNLATITNNVVDLSNNNAPTLNSLGSGATATDNGDEADGILPWTLKTINPGTSTTFSLLIQNKVGIADNYNLSADSDNGFAPLNLPAGWTVTFFNDGGSNNCTTLSTTITNTGIINAGGSLLVCAVVTVPATQVPVTAQSIYFQALSPVTLAGDTKLDAVTVNTFRSVQMNSDNTGQVFPGGSVVYTHTITNNGNVTEGTLSGDIVFTGANTLSGTGFTTVFYIDTNNDGVLDIGDQALNATNFQTLTDTTTGYVGAGANDPGLSPTESIRIFAKVQSPASATPGTTDAATITANVSGTINSVAAPTDPVNTDTTNVIGGQIRLEKMQALDADCNGVADVALGLGNINALPGNCIIYSIGATNNGVSLVKSVLINDTTPAFTKMFSKAISAVVPIVNAATIPAVTGSGTVNTVPTKPADGGTGALVGNVGDLTGGQTATFTFSVKIDDQFGPGAVEQVIR